MDQIQIQGLRVHARHGLTPEEKAFAQEWEVDLIMDCDLRRPGSSDHPEDTLDRRELIEDVEALLKENCWNLAETIAEEIARMVLREYPLVQRAEVQVKQTQCPIPADFDFVGVRIVRER